MASSIMNGRLRPIPTTTAHGTPTPATVKVSALPTSLPKGTISIYSIHQQKSFEKNKKNNVTRRGNHRTTDAHVPVLCTNEDIIAHRQIVTKDIPLNYGDVMLDHCWWGVDNIDISFEFGSNDCSCSSRNDGHRDDDHRNDWNASSSSAIIVLAVLVRRNNNTPTLHHASSSSSIVHLYFYNNTNDTTTKEPIEPIILGKDNNGRLQHITSIPTSYHATAIAMGGNNKGLDNDGVLIIARSSGVELHSLQPILKHYLKGRNARHDDDSSGLLVRDSTVLKALASKLDKVTITAEGSGEQSELHPASTPVRRSQLNGMPTTPLAPKSLLKVFDDASSSRLTMQSHVGPQSQGDGAPTATATRTTSPPPSPPRSMPNHLPNSTKLRNNGPILSAVQQQQSQQPQQLTQEQLHLHHRHCIPPLELLPSFCIHALHLSYPYLAIASGDRIGIWNVDSNFLFGDIVHINQSENEVDNEATETTCDSNTQSGNNGHSGKRSTTEGRRNVRKVQQEALWATTLSNSNSKNSVHRRVTSIYMTPCGEAMAVSCWDGCAYVYIAKHTPSSPPRVVEDDGGTTFLDSFMPSWELVGEGAPCHPSVAVPSVPRVPPIWEQPTTSSEGMFPTFVTLKFLNSQPKRGRPSSESYTDRGHRLRPNKLVMAVSTPGSDTIRCFDVFSKVPCPDISSRENVQPTEDAGEIHGMANASSFSDSGEQEDTLLVWITEKDAIYSRKWTSMLVPSEISEVDDEEKNSASVVRWMKRHSTRDLIAESKSEYGGSCDGNTNKAWLYWHEGCNDPISSSNIPRRSSSWAVQCQWNVTEEDASFYQDGGAFKENVDDSKTINASFLTDSDVIGLTRVAQVDNGCATGRSRNTQAVITRDFLVITIPSYSMIYVYAREHSAWKTIDLQGDENDIAEDTDTYMAVKAMILDSHCFVLLLDEHAESIDVRVWDLTPIFNNGVDQNALYYCSIPIQNPKSISSFELHPMKDNDTCFVVSCRIKHEEREGLQIWEIKCSDEKCALHSDHFIPSSSTFPLENLKPSLIFQLSNMKDECPEHQDLTDLLDADCGRIKDDLIVHFRLQDSSWLCIPRLNLWRPL